MRVCIFLARDVRYFGSQSARAQRSMSLGDCAECLKLHQDVTITTTRHMAAMSRHAVAVQNGADDAEIAELEDILHLRAMERREAFDRYRIHLLRHTAKVSGAGAGLA